ncbi:MAG: response regulator transcription factor [Phycisphaerales bacterium]|nr:response regulator transcription factor [Phycisphaerales bacterium]
MASAPQHILVVDDEPDLLELLTLNLAASGYRVSTASRGRQALTSLQKERPDLVILDVMMPEMSGVEVTRRLRATPGLADLPVMLLTAKAEETDQLVGLSVGADDYITKPFSVKVLLARVAAMLRRSHAEGEAARPGDTLTFGPVTIDLSVHEVRAGGDRIDLTLTEFRVLAALVSAGGRVLGRASLIDKAIGPGITVTERTIDVHMTALRKKLGRASGIIQTVRGLGYQCSLSPQGAETDG